jgi:hypothetical protein
MAYGFVSDGNELETKLEPIEREMLRHLLDNLCEILSRDTDMAEADIDPLARQLGLENLQQEDVEQPEDPVLARLLPAGYRNDFMAAAEFRRYTDQALRRGKLDDAEVVRCGLDRADSDPDGTVRVSQNAAPSWLRAINDLRLALGVQLDISAESAYELASLPDDDPRAEGAAIYDFLTWWQDGLVRALMDEDLDY